MHPKPQIPDLASRCKALSRKCEFAGCDQQRRQVTANASKIKDSAIRGVSNDCSEVRQSGFTRVRQGWGNASRAACATNIHFSIFGSLGPWQFLNIGHQGPHARTSTAILAFHAQTGHRVLAVSQNPCFTLFFFFFFFFLFFPTFLSKHKIGRWRLDAKRNHALIARCFVGIL